MCIAVPSKVIAIKGAMATIDAQGAKREVSLMLLPDAAEIGDYVLVHAGFAIQRIDPEAGIETLALFDEILNKTGSSGPTNA